MSLIKQQAIALANSGWWHGKSSHEIVTVQLFEELLCMDFGAFHKAVEEVLGRPVRTHEFADWKGLQREFLGTKPAPTSEEILDLIPKEKRVLVIAPGPSRGAKETP